MLAYACDEGANVLLQCSEEKPSCRRCHLGLLKCEYPPPPRAAVDDRRNGLSVPSPPRSVSSSSPYASSCSGRSPPSEASTRSTPASGPFSTGGPLQLSDTDLYHHYLRHTSRTLAHCREDQAALQLGMPTLALQSKPVLHSLLALSAACICCDMISEEPSPDLNAVNKALITGYKHYNLASEQMRELISMPDASKLEPLLASALLLVPFATASQQINQWISSRNGTLKPDKFLSSTPRDIIIIMRGIKTTLDALQASGSAASLDHSPMTRLMMESPSPLLELDFPPVAPPSSRNHMMFSIVSSTSEVAFSKLQGRLESMSLSHDDTRNSSFAACAAAFQVLENIRINAFAPSSRIPSTGVAGSTLGESAPELVSPPSQVASWLSTYASGHAVPQPAEPLTRPFLAFLVQVPEAYLDLVLPLLDRRLEGPIVALPGDFANELTDEQALALDIYAHWSVLMFLTEEESWWIGRLPIVTLTSMVKTYGDDFVTKLGPDRSDTQEHWWPGSMLTILRELKRG